MNKLIKYGLPIFVLSITTFLVGWKIGTLHGMNASIQMSESLKIGPVVNELVLLKEKDVDSLLKLKELELDSALLGYSLYREKSPTWTTFPFNKMSEPVLEDSLEKAAEYRKDNPGNKHSTHQTEQMDQVYLRIDQLLDNSG